MISEFMSDLSRAPIEDMFETPYCRKTLTI